MPLGKWRKGGRDLTPAERRVMRMTTPDLYSWAEVSIYSLGRGFDKFRRDPEGEVPVDELILGAESLLVVMEEIKRRTRQTPRTESRQEIL